MYLAFVSNPKNYLSDVSRGANMIVSNLNKCMLNNMQENVYIKIIKAIRKQ